MIKMSQVTKLRKLHDEEKKAYEATHSNNTKAVYEEWVKACDKLNRFIETIATDD